MLTIKDIIDKNLCMGCGLCSVDKKCGVLSYSNKNDCNIPEHKNLPLDSIANKVCPGKGYPIIGLAKELYEDAVIDPMLGRYVYLTAAHTNSATILKNASSGGVITNILAYLLRKGIVDKVSVTQFYCDKEGVHTKSFLTSDSTEILKAQGSKYCPVDLSGLLQELHTYDGRVAVMATPCSIAGIRNIQKYAPNYIKAKIVFTIANFCGGFKSFKNIKRLAEIHNMDYSNLREFRFRGDGQPGSLRFVDNDGNTASTPYPLYVGLNGYSKMNRCFLCPDATGELADIACGDAWIDRFKKDKYPWSMIICRNQKAKDIIKSMELDNEMTLESVTSEEVRASQRLNLMSKKTRQKARRKLYSLLGKTLPEFDGGYSEQATSLKLEAKVSFKHFLTYLAEIMGIYMPLYGHKKLKGKNK